MVMKYKKESSGAYRNYFQNYILNQKTKNLSSISEMIIYIVYASMDPPLIVMLGDNIHLFYDIKIYYTASREQEDEIIFQEYVEKTNMRYHHITRRITPQIQGNRTTPQTTNKYILST